MTRGLVNEAAMRAKSVDLKISYANLCHVLILEEFLRRLSDSVYAECLWIKNTSALKLESYRRKSANRMDFYYQKEQGGRELSIAAVNQMMKGLLTEEKETDIAWIYAVEEADSGYRVEITAEVYRMRIPLCLMIEEQEDRGCKAEELKLRLYMSHTDFICLNTYPREYLAVKYLYQIVDKLELINDMSVYHRLYTILKKETLDGRRVQKKLVKYCEEAGMTVDMRRLDMICTYKSYSYMKKKWRMYLKSEKKNNPQWEELMEYITAFLAPIWKTHCENMIFIGDWMPELGRFLD